MAYRDICSTIGLKILYEKRFSKKLNSYYMTQKIHSTRTISKRTETCSQGSFYLSACIAALIMIAKKQEPKVHQLMNG